MKQIPQYPKYSISEDGMTVLNNETGKTLKQSTDKAGYVWVTLLITQGEYTIKRIAVHRLVALTYITNEDTKRVWVNHIDGIKGNNHVSNLEWTTISENIKHSYDILKRKIYKGNEHWRYGVSIGKVTRNRMSRTKIGELHPKFKGYYCYDGNKYSSLKEAQQATGIEKRKVAKFSKLNLYNWTFSPKKIVLL